MQPGCRQYLFSLSLNPPQDHVASEEQFLKAAAQQRLPLFAGNPPFGKKSSMTFTNSEGEQETDDLTYRPLAEIGKWYPA